MARVNINDGRRIYRVGKWLGLNEGVNANPGEASEMVNWRIGADGKLAPRDGVETRHSMVGAIRGMWCGYVQGVRVVLVASAGSVWKLDGTAATSIGTLIDGATSFFGFNNKVYVLNGVQYKVWTGVGTMTDVVGYVPIISTATPPAGGGYALERANMLTGKKRQIYSPDGSNVYRLAENSIDSVDWVKVNGFTVSTVEYSANLAAGTVTFSPQTTLQNGTNSVEIQYSKGLGTPAIVRQMRFSETYNGLTDTRVFLYGDGSNKAIYSGINEFGEPDAAYFPVLNLVDVDSENTQITAMVKHFDRLLAYKPDGLWAISYGTITLSDGAVTAAFFTIPINREIGNEAVGQVRLVSNYPVSAYGNALYIWETSSVRDERTARRISTKIECTLSTVELRTAKFFDASYRQELYIFCGLKTIVYNYGIGAFYVYQLGEVVAAVEVGETILLGFKNGRIGAMNGATDDGIPIEATWKSAYSSYENDWRWKYLHGVWLRMTRSQDCVLDIWCESENDCNSEVHRLEGDGGDSRIRVKLPRVASSRTCVALRRGYAELQSISEEVSYGGKVM